MRRGPGPAMDPGGCPGELIGSIRGYCANSAILSSLADAAFVIRFGRASPCLRRRGPSERRSKSVSTDRRQATSHLERLLSARGREELLAQLSPHTENVPP